MNCQIKCTLKLVEKARKMLAVFMMVFLFGFSFESFGQEKSNRKEVEVYHSLAPSEIAKHSNFDFKENFAVLLETDKTSNYFFLDLSKLVSSFEMKYFLYLAYQSGNRVQISHGLSNNRAWFIVDKKSPESSALRQILDIRKAASEKDKLLTEREKTDWVKSKNY